MSTRSSTRRGSDRSERDDEVRQVDRIETLALQDQVTYAEAAEITQRSPGYLRNLVNAGRLTRTDAGHGVFLSRAEVEALALLEYRRGRTGDYWMTMTQVATLTGIARANVHQARQAGRLIARRSRLGDWLVRRIDAYQFHLSRQLTLHPQASSNTHDTPRD